MAVVQLGSPPPTEESVWVYGHTLFYAYTAASMFFCIGNMPSGMHVMRQCVCTRVSVWLA